MIYRLVNCVGNAGGQDLDYEGGRHAMHITGSVDGNDTTERVWVLDCELSDNSEDGIQVGQTAKASLQRACARIYIGKNRIERNGENAIDLKSCDKVVVSQNQFSGYKQTQYRAGAVSGSDGTAGVINDDGKGPLESWWVFNRFTQSRAGIRNQAAGGRHYLIGNLVDRMELEAGDAPTSTGYSRGIFYWQSAGAADAFLVNNTIFDVEGGFYFNNVRDVHVWGNIVSGIRNNGVGYPIFINNSLSISVGQNIYFDPGAAVRRDGNALSTANGDKIDVDPKLVNPSADMSLAATSPGRRLATESSVYDTYLATFGESIRFDFYGTPIPVSPPWCAGAVQGQAHSGELPVKPTGLNVDMPPSQ